MSHAGQQLTPDLIEEALRHCDREPITVPGSIQPHGLLLVLEEPDYRARQASANLREHSRFDADEALGKTLEEIFGAEPGQQIAHCLRQSRIAENPIYLRTVTLEGQRGPTGFDVLAHRHDGRLILELEKAPSQADISFGLLYPIVRSFIASLQEMQMIEELGQITAREIRRITGFDRVLLYRFDAEWNGQVLAESRDEGAFHSLEDHWFPASDIPRQARELYRLNRVRIIPDVNYVPVRMVSAQNDSSGPPLDMSFAALRSVSPVHLEYMRNMETQASMSVSIIIEGRLWGLVACHHRTPHHLSFEVRTACDFIGQFLSLQIAAKEFSADSEQRLRMKAINARLLGLMTGAENFLTALTYFPQDILDLTHAEGAAILHRDEVVLLGQTPTREQVLALAEWMAQEGGQELYSTDRLSKVFPGAEPYKAVASGMLAIAISKLHHSYVIWFRPEVIQTIRWGGDPQKHTVPSVAGQRIGPRRSFETWKEVVFNRSLPWSDIELEAAAELRNSIVGIVLRRAEEVEDLVGELERSNQELEAFSHTVSHDLRAPFRHIVGYSSLLREIEGETLSPRGLQYLNNIAEAGQFAGELVDNLLHFSQMSRLPIEKTLIDMNLLVQEVKEQVMRDAEGRRIAWQIAKLPRISGDLMLLRLVWCNLMANAVKYSRGREVASIIIEVREDDLEYVFSVADNGVGFDMKYADKLFGVFQRLHKIEDFEGTGIGLANVRRIVSRHGGRTWAEGETDRGATFFFSLPKHREVQHA